MRYIEYLKEGSGIHINPKNKGKFTASAKAAGKSVLEHAKDVLNDPNATALLRRRANFARNSKKWAHSEGGSINRGKGNKHLTEWFRGRLKEAGYSHEEIEKMMTTMTGDLIRKILAKERIKKHSFGGNMKDLLKGGSKSYYSSNKFEKDLEYNIEDLEYTPTSRATASDIISEPGNPNHDEDWELGIADYNAYISGSGSNIPPSTTVTVSKPRDMSKKRGDINNNWLNIRISDYDWLGKVKDNTDGAFELFETAAYGFRAAALNLKSFVNKHGLNTVSQIISRWAPTSDGNNPLEYTRTVLQRSGIRENEIIDPNNKEQMEKLMEAMAFVENGYAANIEDIRAGLNMLG